MGETTKKESMAERYQREYYELHEYFTKLNSAYSRLYPIRTDIIQNPENYTSDIEDIRRIIKLAMPAAKALSKRKSYHNLDGATLAKETVATCRHFESLIGAFYHPYEIYKLAKERTDMEHAELIEKYGAESKDNIDFLYTSMESLEELKAESRKLCRLAKANDPNWKTLCISFLGEMDYIIKRCKFIYRKYSDSEVINRITNHKLIYECRLMSAKIRRWVDPATDYM